MRKLYRLFVTVAVFNLLTISFALLLNYRITQAYSSSLAASSRWMNRIARNDELEKLSNEVDAPGNDVFDNGDVTTEAQRMEAALTRFNQALSESRREIAKEPPSEARPMLMQIHEIDGLMQAMVADGRLIFRALLQGQRPEAAARMARMDRGRATLQQELIRADDLIRRFQANEFRQQQQYVGTLRLYGYYVVALIGLSIIALALYARRLLRELLVVDQREQYLSKLEAREEELRKSEERFHLAARATNDLVFDWDLKTNMCWASEALEHQFGFPASGDIDITVWSNAIHPDDLQHITRDIQAAIAAGEQLWSGEYRFRRGDGVYADVLTHGYLVRNAGGKPSRMVGATMDMTERKSAERAYNTVLLNSTADGIFGLDARGNASFVNQSAARLLGWEVNELVGKDMHQITHHHHVDGTDYPWENCLAYKTLRDGTSGGSNQEVFWCKDGSSIAVEYAATPIRHRDGQVIGAVVTFRDISERRHVERMKDEFVSVVSHELRTPLTSIRGALGLLAGGRIGEIPEKGKRMLDIAVANTDRLVRLINDILDIERMESGKVTLTRQLCDAHELMSQAIELIRPMADKAHVMLGCAPCDASLWADPDRLLQTFSNLLSNAVKFSPPGASVSLSASVANDNVVFEVADQGRGIPADKLDLIFERFQQVDASDSREKGGTGLGLAICRTIVQQHGGEIHVESTHGQGSRFRFTIPRPVRAVTAPSVSRSVVVCDDDPSIREIMCSLLEQKEYRAVGVASGRELLNRVSTLAPDVILLDLLMPEMNGCETLAALKSDPATASIPVIISSVLSPEESDWPFADLVGWIQKPFDERAIVDAVEHAFRSPSRRQILLVEDDLDLARVIAEGFERHGVQTVHAASGAAAIELAQKMTPDLLILDLILPDIDGFGVVDWLKDNDRLRSVPVVVYSALEPTPSQRDRLKLGPTEFLTKSRIPPEEFERRVIQLLDNMILPPKGDSHHVA